MHLIELEIQDLTFAQNKLNQLYQNLNTVYFGDPNALEMMIFAFLAQGHVLLEGAPGLAKTTLSKAFAHFIQCPFKRIQFTPDLLPTDILGASIYSPTDQCFYLQKGPIFTHILLADELNRAPAKTQSALLEAMQESQVSLEGQTYALAPPFMVIATQNPIEQTGVYPLPEAQLDRFLICLRLTYPSAEAELQMLQQYHAPMSFTDPCLTLEDCLLLQSLQQRVFVHPAIFDYALQIIRATRSEDGVLFGASPRAGLALIRLAKARALFKGRAFVSVDDIKYSVIPCLSHRMILEDQINMAFAQQAVIENVMKQIKYQGPEKPCNLKSL
jgi:MoxR-like ATPase